jgi:RNA polymerase sigma-70 factor (ECF subfamily)
VNTCRDVAQRQRARATEPLLEDRRVARDGDPTRAAAMSELRSELCRSLAGLSAEQAQVVVLKDVVGLSFEEISAASGMPVGTAKCYAHRGRNGLRARLAAAEVA